MPSPQDSSNSGGENMYTMMKPVPGGNMPGVSIASRPIEVSIVIFIIFSVQTFNRGVFARV